MSDLQKLYTVYITDLKFFSVSDIVGKQQEFTLGYDYLVVAVGAQTATFNIKGVAENTHYLKNVKQAQEIRKNIMDSFETANMPGQPDHEIRRLLHFVVVGGGPTGSCPIFLNNLLSLFVQICNSELFTVREAIFAEKTLLLFIKLLSANEISRKKNLILLAQI